MRLISKANGTVKHQQYWDSTGYGFNLSANSGNFKFTGGNVGIGTTSPATKLEVNGGTDAIVTITGTTTAARLDIKTDSYHRFLQTIESDGRFRLYNQTTATEQLTVTNAGNVGIGTTSPFGTTANRTCLSVNGSTDVSLNIGTGGVQKAYLYSEGNYARLATIGSIPLTLGVDDTEKMRIDSTGNVGIGTTSPTRKLQVEGGDFYTNDKSDTIGANVGYGGNSFQIRNGSTSEDLNFDIFNRTTSTWGTPFVIKNTGNIGIGTTSPAHKLTVNAPNDTTAVGIDFPSAHFDFSANSTSGYTTSFHMDDTATTIGSNSDVRALKFQTNNTDRLYIKGNTGNVGIGTTSPGAKLHVDGGIQMADDTDTASADKVGTMRYRTDTEYVEVDGEELVTNGDLAVSTGWNLQNSASINNTTGVATVPGAGSLGSTAGNWSLYQDSVMDPNKTYMLRFQARRDAGPNANMYAGWAYTNQFSQTVTADWVQYEVVFTTTSSTWDELTFGGVTGTTFEVKDIAVVEVTEEDASYADMCMQTGASTYEWVNIIKNTY